MCVCNIPVTSMVHQSAAVDSHDVIRSVNSTNANSCHNKCAGLFNHDWCTDYVEKTATAGQRVSYPFQTTLVLNWLKSAKIDCASFSAQYTLFHFLGDSTPFLATNSSTYWTKPQQFFTWFKNSVERVQKLTHLVSDSLPYYDYFTGSTHSSRSQPMLLGSADELVRLQRAFFCKTAIALALGIKRHFYIQPAKFEDKYAPFCYLEPVRDRSLGAGTSTGTNQIGAAAAARSVTESQADLGTFAPALALKVRPSEGSVASSRKRKISDCSVHDTTSTLSVYRQTQTANFKDIFAVPALLQEHTSATAPPRSPMATMLLQGRSLYTDTTSPRVHNCRLGEGGDPILYSIQQCNRYIAEVHDATADSSECHQSLPQVPLQTNLTGCSCEDEYDAATTLATVATSTNSSSSSSVHSSGSSGDYDPRPASAAMVPPRPMSLAVQQLFSKYYQRSGAINPNVDGVSATVPAVVPEISSDKT